MTASRRILHLWLPRLATDRVARARARRGEALPAGTPEATVDKVRGALLVSAVNEAAEAQGLAPGLTLAEARALVPRLKVSAADPGADADALLRLASAAGCYTPLVGLDAPDGLVLDITGCAHLFGGEAALLGSALSRFAHWGFAVRGAIAQTPLVARGLARHGTGGVVPDGAAREAFLPLPSEALCLPDDTVAVLHRLGLKTVRHVLAQPRAALVQRFGAAMARRIEACENLGNAPITPIAPVAPYVAERRFAEPLMSVEAVGACLASLAAELARLMERRGEGARRLVMRLFHADGAVREAAVLASEPLADPSRMARLLSARLETLSGRVETDSGIDLIRLHGFETGPLPDEQAMLSGGIATAADLAALVDTLCERLGSAAVTRLVPADAHQPAAAQERLPAREVLEPPPWMPRAPDTALAAPDPAPPVPAPPERPSLAGPPQRSSLSGPPERPSWSEPPERPSWSEPPERPSLSGPPERSSWSEPPERPIRLLDPPEPVETLASVPDGPPVRFVWRRVFHTIAVAEGPERIAAPWWNAEEAPPTCDYFRVEDTDGRRFWMFREGLYGRESAVPRWFMHGLFA